MNVDAVSLMRSGLTLALILLSACAPAAQENSDVRVQLSLANGKNSYHGGEPIVLKLTFTARLPGYLINTITTEPASPVDQVLLSPAKGAYPWLDDYSRERRYYPDYETSNEMQLGQSVTVKLPLNALYRFDQPGRYTVHVITSRISYRGVTDKNGVGALTSNDVSFETVPMDDSDEAVKAARLELLIRSAPDLQTAQCHARELQWLTGDPSTRVKLSLFLHPKEFYPFGVDVSYGLWVARNRALVVSTLEQAMSDPQQPIGPIASVLGMAVALKSRLESPYNPASPNSPLAVKQIENTYVRRIAATLPLRQGDNLVGTAITLLTTMAQRGETTAPEFQAARDAIVTHFADVNEYQIDWVLNGYGKYLEDARIIPALENILRTAGFMSSRAAVLKQLNALRANNLKLFVIAEVCDPKSLPDFDVLSAMPFDSLPEVDSCLLDQIREYAHADARQEIYLEHKTALAARFATAAICDDVLAMYMQYGKTWTGEARGAMLAYLMRYHRDRSRPLLDTALPSDAPNFDPSISFWLFRSFYSPALDDFLRTRLESAPPGQASMAASEMSAHGAVEDQAILRKRLDRWNAKWAGHVSDLRPEQAELQSDLIQAVIRGQNWQVSEAEASELRQSCLSEACRVRLGTKH